MDLRALRTRLARADLKVTLLGTLQKAGAALTYVGPLAATLSPLKYLVDHRWDGGFLFGGSLLAVLGSVCNQGANYLIAQGQKGTDRRYANRLTAGLRVLHGLLKSGGREDPSRFHDQLVRCIVDTVEHLSPREGATVLCCLLRPSDTHLDVVAYSAFRENRVPSALMPITEPDGAARAYREKTVVHLQDVSRGAHASSFVGKPYRSILAIPVLDGEHCIGVIAIDSTVAGHFEETAEDLAAHVFPFVEMVRLSLPSVRQRARRADGGHGAA